MAFVFNPAKDEENRRKHGVSLAKAENVRLVLAEDEDERFVYDEPRVRAWGYLDERPCCVAFTYRGDDIRVISLRYCTEKEITRHARRLGRS